MADDRQIINDGISSMEIGDRVTVTFYGEEHVGTVIKNNSTRNPNGGMVWVVLDGKTIANWFHPESVTPVTDTQKQDG